MSPARIARRIATTTAAASLALTVGAAPVLADDVAPGATQADVLPEPEPAPAVFALMDGTGDPSKVAADVALLIGEDAEDKLLRLNLAGQYVSPGGYGGYAVISAMTDTDNDVSAVSNLELGGLGQFQVAPEVSLGVRVGLILPTADLDEDFFGGLISTLVARPADLAAAYPETTWLRLGVSPTYRKGSVFLRADAGVDLVLDSDFQFFEEDPEPLGHLNLGAGVSNGRWAATVEVQTLAILGGDEDERFMHTAAVSVQARAGAVTPFLAVSSPLDDEPRGEVVGITLGVDARF